MCWRSKHETDYFLLTSLSPGGLLPWEDYYLCHRQNNSEQTTTAGKAVAGGFGFDKSQFRTVLMPLRNYGAGSNSPIKNLSGMCWNC